MSTKPDAFTCRVTLMAACGCFLLGAVIAGLQLHFVLPAIGLVPLFFSSAYSALLLANERRCGCQAGGLTGTPFHFIVDFVIGVGLLVCVILTWVLMEGGWNGEGIMMGTYGTTFLIWNL